MHLNTCATSRATSPLHTSQKRHMRHLRHLRHLFPRSLSERITI